MEGLGCVFLGVLSRGEWLLVRLGDSRATVLSGLYLEALPQEQRVNVQEGPVMVADAVSALPVFRSILHSYPAQLLLMSAPPMPLPLLPGARVSQDGWKCPGAKPPGAAPIIDSDGSINSPDSGPQVAQLCGMFYPNAAHRTSCDDGDVLCLCCPIWQPLAHVAVELLKCG